MSAFMNSLRRLGVYSVAQQVRRGAKWPFVRRWAATCALALSLWGCVNPLEWRQDGIKTEQVKHDQAVCEFGAEVLAGPVSAVATSEHLEARKEQVKKLTSLCMTSRGYKLEQVPIEP